MGRLAFSLRQMRWTGRWLMEAGRQAEKRGQAGDLDKQATLAEKKVGGQADQDGGRTI